MAKDRSNLAIEHIKNLILKKWDEVIIASDDGLNKRIKMNQAYEDAVADYSDQVGRVITGFEKLDQAKSKAQFDKIADKILEIARNDLIEAQLHLLESYLDALFEAVEEDLD